MTANSNTFRSTMFVLVAIAVFMGWSENTLGQSAPNTAGPPAQRQATPLEKSNPWDRLPVYTFPRIGQNTLRSPNGRYLLENADCDACDRATTNWHTIYLIDTKRHTREVLYRYGRSVNVLWSPSSEAIAVNDFYASDDSRSILFTLTPRLGRIDLTKRLMGAPIPVKEREFVRDGYPVFKFVDRWLDSQSLLFKATGYAEAEETGFKDPFTFVYVYRIGGSFVPALSIGVRSTTRYNTQ